MVSEVVLISGSIAVILAFSIWQDYKRMNRRIEGNNKVWDAWANKKPSQKTGGKGK